MSRYLAMQIADWKQFKISKDGKRKVPSRPDNHKFDSLFTRLKLAFGVLIGKYDALNWDNESIFAELKTKNDK